MNSRKYEAGSWKPEAGSWKSVVHKKVNNNQTIITRWQQGLKT